MRKVKHKSGGISIITTVFFVAVVVVGVLCVTRYYDLHNRRERLEAEAAALHAKEEALIERKNQLDAQSGRSSAADIEDAAREQLDMVYPGEIIFRTNGD